MSRSWLGGVDLEFLEGLLDRLPEAPFFIKDASLRFVAANQAMLRLCGLAQRSEIIGRRSADFFPEAASRRYEALDREVFRRGRALPERVELIVGAGRPSNWLLFARLPVHDHDGRVVGVAAVSRRLGSADPQHPTYARLAGMVEQLNRNFDRPLALPALASAAGVSRSQLQRDFRAVFQLSPRQYQGKLRLDRALELLHGPSPIAGIAAACGYVDQSAFARRFKEAVGLTPSQYRQSIGRPRD